MWQLFFTFKDHLTKWLWRFLLLGFASILATGCASMSVLPAKKDSTDIAMKIHTDPPITEEFTNDIENVKKRLRSEVRMWEGTPHKIGGETRQGIDCSGFVQRLYRDIFGQRIPRSTKLQVKSGQSIEKNQLYTGDLVFFKSTFKRRHVGIYLGLGEFAHASASKGVTISSLQNPYWAQSYWTARRYLNASH
jgi:cell wall-associated NlpC family hydrolase